ADDPGDAAGLRAGGCVAARGGIFGGCGHDTPSFPTAASASALAPPTISLISWVISACRALLASRVNCSSRSLALSVADFIARRRAAISEAAASSSAWEIRLSTYQGSSASSTSGGEGSNSYSGNAPAGGGSALSSISIGRILRTTDRWVSMDTNSVKTQ